ncbi:MAG TPA: glycosyltransferase family 1 protein [Candidatus Moranbacteria bacterium]|nr:glycosyltransferase family 1 protein [Candidatus Moranbacteria bacterium]
MLTGIDARFYGTIGKGLGRYTQKLIENLEKIDQENRYVVFLRKENFDEYQPKNKNFQKVLADYRWYSFAEQLFFPKLLRKYNFDLVHFPHFNVPLLYRKNFVITIHDLILIHFPTVRSSTLSPIFYWLKFLAYKIVIWSAVHRAKKIIAVSNFTKKDILNVYKKVPENKVIVTYEACDNQVDKSSKNDEEILQFRDIMKPYIIYIGNVYPHKNPERLVLAFKEVLEHKKDIALVFVGGEDYFYLRLKKFVVENRIENIIFVGFVPDNEMKVLLRNAQAYVRPSLYEGFELPPLEAMQQGVPVLCSDHECALEVLDDSVLYFDGKNIESMKKAILKIITDEKLRQDLIVQGRKQVEKYSWNRMAQETLKIYKK